MALRHFVGLFVLGTLFAAFVSLGTHAPGLAAEKITYSGDVFPVIQIRCLECHKPDGSGYAASGLDLRTYEGLMKGTRHGPMVIPGEPFVSNLIVLVEGRASPDLRMPHGGKRLTRCEIDILRRWIKLGAKND